MQIANIQAQFVIIFSKQNVSLTRVQERSYGVNSQGCSKTVFSKITVRLPENVVKNSNDKIFIRGNFSKENKIKHLVEEISLIQRKTASCI